VRDHLVATVESYAPLMARRRRRSTSLLTSRGAQALGKHIGMVDLPLLSTLATASAGGTSFGEHDAGAA
jgi:hypothetical protein